jgi:chromosome partitioning protein
MSEPPAPTSLGLKIPEMAAVLVTSTKGGTGKTSTVTVLAVAAKEAGHSVCVIDLDQTDEPEHERMRDGEGSRNRGGSISNWHQRRLKTRKKEGLAADIVVSSIPLDSLSDAMRIAHASGATFVIIDTEGHRTNGADVAAQFADLVLIPSRPAIKEMEKMGQTTRQLERAGNPPAFVSFNRVQPMGKFRLDEARFYADKVHKLPALPVSLTQRIIYDDADVYGLAPQELEKDGPATTDARALFRFISDFLALGAEEQPETKGSTQRRAV